MLCDYFCSYLFIIEDLKIYIGIIRLDTSTDTPSDRIYKTEGSNNENSGKDSYNNKNSKDKDDGTREEVSFEIEEEIEDLERLMKLSNNAMILDEKLPHPQKDKNRYLNDLRKDPNVKEFFEGKTPNASDLPELNKALKEAKEEKIKELAEAANYAHNELPSNSLKDQSDSSLDKLNNNVNKDDTYDSDYKVGNIFLDFLIEILKNFFD
jgi:hypothetical protein